MKIVSKLIGFVLLLLCITACQDDKEPEAPVIPSAATLNGTWRLADWNGQQEEDNWYVYITFDRLKDTYVMYQRVGSMVAEKKTGTFTIEKDADTNDYVLSGTYDYFFNQGVWEHDYIITELTADAMTLTAKDDVSDVQKYVRVESVPEDIVKGTRSIR